MSEQQRRAVLLKYPDSQAAQILGLSRERVRQLRIKMNIPISTQQADKQMKLRAKEFSFLRCYDQDISSTELDYKHAKEYAEVFNLPWPPKKDIEKLQSVKIYRFAEQHTDFTWEQLNVVFKVQNACSIARQAAQRYDLPWPLRNHDPYFTTRKENE